MKVLLINSDSDFILNALTVPLGLMSIATMLNKNGHEAKIIDRSWQFDKPEKLISDLKPDVVGISISSSVCVRDAVAVSKRIKKCGVPLIWGGSFVTMDAECAVRSGLPDYVSVGEGEFTWLELADALRDGTPPEDVPGLMYLRGGEVVSSPERPLCPLSELEPLDWSLISPEHYIQRYIHCSRMIFTYASKGCTSRCTFCTNPLLHRCAYRIRPIDHVMADIEYLVKNHGIDGIYFSDECWCARREDAEEFCRQIKERGLNIHWGAQLSLGIYSEKELRMMYDAGCRWLLFGIESGSHDILQQMKKIRKPGIELETIHLCNKIGISVVASFIAGFPGETPEQLRDTVRIAIQLSKEIVSFCHFTLMPGSEMYRNLLSDGKVAPKKRFADWSRAAATNRVDVNYSQVPPKELRVVRASFRWNNFKKTPDEKKEHAVAAVAVTDTLRNLARRRISTVIPALYRAVKEFLTVFWFSHAYPGVKKKYGLDKIGK